MSDATYIELPPQPSRRRSFFRSWKGAVLLLFLAAVLVAGWFSWWLSEGRISSSYARVDTVVYTVGTQTTAKVEQVLVGDGQAVSNGQPLARLAPGQSQEQKAAPQEPVAGKQDATEESEKRVSAMLARARAEEANLQKIHHERVTEHVRAQLALRSTNPGYFGAYEEAARIEADARNRMNQAREQFEKASKARAILDLEMARIHYELARRKPRKAAQAREQVQAEPAAPIPAQPAAPGPEFLYAPVNGRIVGVGAVAGQIAQQGQPLFLIMPAGPGTDSWIQAWFPVSAQRMLKMGQKATVKSGDLHLTGKVSAISPEAQYLPTANGQGQYAQYLPVRITISDPAELAKLVPGTTVQCQIQTRYVIDQEIF
ncbi:MAG: HlyD family efflux transporter periplasmic adaptor subunit [Desulfovibrio sp.]|nr:HlyD family efflux transporter periplasmic adaptor subunit [Desulfovibrio sp.]